MTVGIGDTVEKMAGRMQVADHPMERFLILNGLDRDAKLAYGSKVKIVVE